MVYDHGFVLVFDGVRWWRCGGDVAENLSHHVEKMTYIKYGGLANYLISIILLLLGSAFGKSSF